MLTRLLCKRRLPSYKRRTSTQCRSNHSSFATTRVLSRQMPPRTRPQSAHLYKNSTRTRSVYQDADVSWLWLAMLATGAVMAEHVEGGDEEAEFTAEEVAEHSSRESGVWVTYLDGVYDVTDFVDEHPGGAQFLLDAAGGAVENFWGYWAYHLVSPKPLEYLKQYRIGKLKGYNPRKDFPAEKEADLYYADEPARSASHIPSTARPFDSETDLRVLATHYLTPNDSFFVRNHAPVPYTAGAEDHVIDFVVDVAGQPQQKVALSLGSIKRAFQHQTITTAMQCAGNRAAEMSRENGKPTAFTGTPFENLGAGMIGNAQWRGVRLAEVLHHLVGEQWNSLLHRKPPLHVTFEGADGYYTSTPLPLVGDLLRDALLATEMNGVPLPPDHGYPVRVLLPGVAGARNVKWVSTVKLSDTPADSCWMNYYYKDGRGDSSELRPVQEVPMQSLLLSPIKGETVLASTDGQRMDVPLKGVAWAGGESRDISRVEISVDRGATWQDVELLRDEVARDHSSRMWSWVRWRHNLPVTQQGDSPVDVFVRAYDGSGRPQPSPQNSFNSKGYLYNGWHHVQFYVQPVPQPQTQPVPTSTRSHAQ